MPRNIIYDPKRRKTPANQTYRCTYCGRDITLPNMPCSYYADHHPGQTYYDQPGRLPEGLPSDPLCVAAITPHGNSVKGSKKQNP